MSRIALLVLLILISSGLRAQEVESSDEFRVLLERLHRRYDDFFTHWETKYRLSDERQKGAQDVRNLRAMQKQEAEVVRKRFVSERKQKVEDMEGLRLFEKEKLEQARNYEKARQAFVSKRKKLESVEHVTKRIPLEVEAGLDESD